MNRILTTTIALVSATAVHASPVLIDNFSNNQSVSVPGGGSNPTSNFSNIAASNAIGGTRSIIITRISGDADNSVNVASGRASLNSGADDEAQALFIWDGDNNQALNASGLGGQDLTSGGSNIFLFIALRSDLSGAPVTVRVYTDAANYSTAVVTTPGGGFGATPWTNHNILFSSFTATGAGANFANVGAITLSIDGTNFASLDTQVDLLEARPTPEPSTMLLIGASLVAISLRGIRRAKKA